MKVELENILDIGTTLYSLDENFKIKRKVVVNIQSVFEQNVSHSPEIHTTYKVSNTMSKGVLTPLEHERLNAAFSIIRGVVRDSVESSIELGFNAKRRCTFGVCRKPAIEGSEYCREYKEYMEERQCQR